MHIVARITWQHAATKQVFITLDSVLGQKCPGLSEAGSQVFCVNIMYIMII